MQKSKFKNLITKGEIAREKRDYKTALACFWEAMLISGKQKNWADYVEALGHIIVIDKHFWWETKDQGFLEQMRSHVKLGLEMCKIKHLPKTHLAVFQLRASNIFLEEKNFKRAVLWSHRAVKSLAEISKNAGYAEYLGHWGTALVLAGEERAERVLLRALKLMRQDEDVRPFHRLVLESRILASLSLFYKEKNPKKSKELFNEALVMSRELRDKYKMPMRLKQLGIMKKEFKL